MTNPTHAPSWGCAAGTLCTDPLQCTPLQASVPTRSSLGQPGCTGASPGLWLLLVLL